MKLERFQRFFCFQKNGQADIQPLQSLRSMDVENSFPAQKTTQVSQLETATASAHVWRLVLLKLPE